MIHQCLYNTNSSSALHITLVGVGGNGSKMLIGLKNLHLALKALGSYQLYVTAYDPDLVSSSNLVRQTFFESDIGQNKTKLLIHRLNISCGLNWSAEANAYTRASNDYPSNILISCVDTRAARAQIVQSFEKHFPQYWLDLGNDSQTGQFILGQPAAEKTKTVRNRLRTATELFPEIADTRIPEDSNPSCTTREALERQDLFVNDILTAQALNLLSQLLKDGQIAHHGGFINAQLGSVTPLPIELKTWNRFARARTK